jgi:hypothetical protein
MQEREKPTNSAEIMIFPNPEDWVSSSRKMGKHTSKDAGKHISVSMPDKG